MVDFISKISAFLTNYSGYVLTVLAILFLFITIGLVILYLRFNKLWWQYTTLMGKNEGKSLEYVLNEYLERVGKALKRVDGVEMATGILAEEQTHCLQKVGRVRFNAFPTLSGEESFALALLDAKGDGVVITNLYGPEQTRIYAKPIKNKQSLYPLSKEEHEAVQMAIGTPRANIKDLKEKEFSRE